MPRWKVLVTAPRACEVIARYRHELEAAGCDVVARQPVQRFREEDLLPLVCDVDGIICGDDEFTERVLVAAPKLRVISKWGTGIDSIDLDAAKRRGVAVRNTPDAFSDPVADTVLGYVLLFARGLQDMASEMRDGQWRRPRLLALRECTLGIVGFGNIGRAVARRAVAFGMTVIAAEIRPLQGGSAPDGVRMVDLDELLATSDFVTLHANLHRDNRQLINAARLRSMRRTAILINTARGALVEEAALVTALVEGRIAGAALDVFEDEPLSPTSPLRSLRNVYLAPHNSNASPAAAERVHANTIGNLLQGLAGSAA